MKAALHVLLLFTVMAAPAHAQTSSYPSRTTRIIVGFVAGGPSDLVARLVAQGLSERMGQQFVVENRPGATGAIGAELVAKSPPDGYTLYLASQTTHAVAPALLPRVGYDPLKDFVTIVRVAHNPLLMVVHPSMPVKSFNELLALARSRPGQINFATGGIGSSPHMSMELIKSITKVNIVPVHYKGDGAAIIDLLGGHMQLFNASIGTLLPHARSGKLRGLAVTSLKRSAMADDDPSPSGADPCTTSMARPLGSVTRKRRSPHGCSQVGMVISTPSLRNRVSSDARSGTTKEMITPAALGSFKPAGSHSSPCCKKTMPVAMSSCSRDTNPSADIVSRKPKWEMRKLLEAAISSTISDIAELEIRIRSTPILGYSDALCIRFTTSVITL